MRVCRLWFGCIALAVISLSLVEVPAGQRALRRSDVVFMYDNPKLYGEYGCTVLGWAGRADAEHIRRAHRSGVRLFTCSIGFLTEFRRVIDFSPDFLDAACRNFSGEPFTVPWLWDHHYKGQPAYWWCTNSPLYRRYLLQRLREVMAAGPDGLHIDDYRGTSGSITWLSGGFCRHCMAAFRKYLAEHVPKERLAELGVTDLEHFDYREFLRRRGVRPEQYRRQRGRLPLAAEFLDFQVKAATQFVAQFHRKAIELRGKPITLSVNSGLNSPIALAVAPYVSYFCCEVSHQASRLKPADHPVYIYKLADGLDRPVASTASGYDWALINEQGRDGLVRTWIALSYAFGHNFMGPHRQWCYTKQKGTHWYSGPTASYAPLYRFVRKHAELLDGYEAVAPVAVVYDNAARRRGRANIEPICVELARRSVPFTIAVAGDDWLNYRLDPQRVRRFKAVIVPEQLGMDKAQRAAIGQVRAAGRLVVWPNWQKLNELVPAPIQLSAAGPVWAVPRAKPNDLAAPAVLHLLNRSYDAKADAVKPIKNVTVRIRRDLFGGRSFALATVHAPGRPEVTLNVSSGGQHFSFTVPELGLWCIVALR